MPPTKTTGRGPDPKRTLSIGASRIERPITDTCGAESTVADGRIVAVAVGSLVSVGSGVEVTVAAAVSSTVAVASSSAAIAVADAGAGVDDGVAVNSSDRAPTPAAAVVVAGGANKKKGLLEFRNISHDIKKQARTSKGMRASSHLLRPLSSLL
jgi:hypothetical protein